MKKFFYIFFLSVIFSFLIFFIKNYFFGEIKEKQNFTIEEKYIDPIYVPKKELEIDDINISDNQIIKNILLEDLSSAKAINYKYIPKNFDLETGDYTDILKDFFERDKIKNKINNLNIELNKDIFDTRGKMKDKTIKLFGVLKMDDSEFLSVGIHEFGHYVDLYILEKKVLKDISDYFYNISWETTKTIKTGLIQKDFVSGYAMTNKYEDFAESFTYYILHNKDFLEKSKESNILLKKYIFFENNVFILNEFKNTNFSNSIIKNYYRDITKINYNLKNFLQYSKNLL